jgi:hypothetical protein
MPFISKKSRPVDKLITGAVIKAQVVGSPGPNDRYGWVLIYDDREDVVSAGWLAAMIENCYVVFSIERDGYIATDRLRNAV